MGRTEKNLNREWKFTYGEWHPQTEEETASWSDVGIPHSFGIPYFMENEFYTGYGTYYKKICVSEKERDQKLLLEFSGVFQVAEVYWNGELLKVHKGGYTPFVVELTGKAEAENDLVVCVNNLWNGRIAPRAGEHQFNGGIYRDVRLIVSSKSCIDWHGTFIYTKELLEETGKQGMSAVLGAETTVLLEEKKTGKAVLCTRLLDGERILAEEERTLKTADRQTVKQRFEVEGIHPWSPETPVLYQMVSEILVDGKVQDSFFTEFGIRTATFDSDQGFFLNGKHYDILGANVHQDHAGWADAVTHAGIYRDVRLIKECGMNFIRGSHYPHHTVFAQACDREGILFWSELCFWGTGGPNQDGYWTSSAYPVKQEDEEEFEQNCLETLEEMILANRNHPSIIVWSMSNEPFFTEAATLEKAKRLLRKLAAKSHQLDPTRPAAAGGAQRGDFDILGDLAGYNGDGASLYQNPGFPNFVSEYGSVVSDRPGKAEPRYRDGVEESFPWRSGKALWCGFHHGSIFGDMGHMGMIDYYRLPLATWYWYREHLRGIPMPEPKAPGVPDRLVLTSDRKEFRADGEEDAWIHVELVDETGKCLANTVEVHLEVVEGDGIFPTGKQMELTPKQGSFLDGEGAIEFRSWYGGTNVIRASAEGVKEAFLTIQAVGEPRKRELIPMERPPYLTPMPKTEYLYDTAACRPVFASSSRTGYEAKYVTVDASQTWIPEGKAEEWVMVDLEGARSIQSIEVYTEACAGENLQILLSKDGETFETASALWQSGHYEWKQKCEYRYVKVFWKPDMKAVKQICIFEKSE